MVSKGEIQHFHISTFCEQIYNRAYFLTLPNSDSARSPSQSSHGKRRNVENFVLLQWHGNTFVTFQRFQV